ncbi:MAG: hypothetical protein PHH71_04160 [Clostridia bacterium]|nr:hypothetical protein [Clostridia bacterium]MDD3232477.1 hypothetical protein [Clostridia bacterium]MDD3862703.1 hypothetical protein [Clostridia bacterium]
MKNDVEFMLCNPPEISDGNAIKVIRELDLGNSEGNGYDLYLDYIKSNVFQTSTIFKNALKNGFIASKNEFVQFAKEVENFGLDYVRKDVAVKQNVAPFGEKNPVRNLRKDSIREDSPAESQSREDFEESQKESQKREDFINFISDKVREANKAKTNIQHQKSEPIKAL